MIARSPYSRPVGAAFQTWASRVMDVILHLGAHCTAATSLQDYLRRHSDILKTERTGYVGPAAGPDQTGAKGSPLAALETATGDVDRIIASDTNMIGAVGDNIRQGTLYPDIKARLARVGAALDGRAITVLFSIRNLETYWCAALAQHVGRGRAVPDSAALDQIAKSRRGWRDVITDMAEALPQARICVLPFEQYAGRPEVFLAQGAGISAPFDHERKWLNRTPRLPELRRVLRHGGGLPFGMGRWNPFALDGYAALRELHADDMMWLTAGADGAAILTEDCERDRVGHTPPPGKIEKGQSDELEERQLARPG